MIETPPGGGRTAPPSARGGFPGRDFLARACAKLVFLLAQYAGISMVLNAYDVPLPADAE